jgi:hypothetical protein
MDADAALAQPVGVDPGGLAVLAHVTNQVVGSFQPFAVLFFWRFGW